VPVFISLSAEKVQAAFIISHECLEIHCFPEGKMFWKINISNSETETIRINEIKIKDLEGTVVADYDIKTEIPFGENKVIVIEATVPQATNYTKFFYRPCFTFYKMQENKITVLDERCYDIMNITVMPKPLIRCWKDSDCPESMFCSENLCFKLECSACQFIKEHKCIDYQCCSNSDCETDEFCNEHNCLKIDCKNDEFIKEHACEKLKCEFNEKPVNHECVKNKIIQGAIIASELIVIFLLIFLTVTKVKFNKKTILQMIREKKKIAFHKKIAEKHLKEAKMHRELIRYLKNKEDIELHEKEAKMHEAEAKKHIKELEKILKLKTCPECGKIVESSSRKCPYCGEQLRGR